MPTAAQVGTMPAINSDGGIWFADDKILKQIDPVTHDITQQINLDRKAQALAIDPNDQALWVLTRKRLLKFDANAHPLLAIELEDLTQDNEKKHKWHNKKALDKAEFLALNPYDQAAEV